MIRLLNEIKEKLITKHTIKQPKHLTILRKLQLNLTTGTERKPGFKTFLHFPYILSFIFIVMIVKMEFTLHFYKLWPVCSYHDRD